MRFDSEDWDKLLEEVCDCPLCQQKIRVYFSPTRDDYMLLGFYCRHCDTPYTELFQTMRPH